MPAVWFLFSSALFSFRLRTRTMCHTLERYILPRRLQKLMHRPTVSLTLIRNSKSSLCLLSARYDSDGVLEGAYSTASAQSGVTPPKTTFFFSNFGLQVGGTRVLVLRS